MALARLPFLGGVEATLLQAVGCKAARLHEAAACGFPVPPGFVIVAGQPLPELSDERLAAAVESIGGWPVAVRSSGGLEDLPAASFAGLYESYLGVADLAALRRRIGDCRASAGAPRVESYRRHAGLGGAAGGLAVLVQRQVDARLAGVAFSIAPDSGREEHGLIECCSGTAERLVSGRASPTRYRVELESGRLVELVPGADGAALSEEQIQRLSALLLDLQARFGCPQDVEWAIDGAGRIELLQSRPVTRVQWRSDVEELTSADLRDGGVSAQVCTPLMFSLYRAAMQPSLQRYFEGLGLVSRRAPAPTWLHHFYGRAYWNASAAKRALAKVPGFSELDFDRGLGLQKQYAAEGPLQTPTNLGTVLRALPVAVALAASFRRQLRAVARFRPAFAAARDRHLLRLGSLADLGDDSFFAELDEVLHRFHPWTERTYFATVYNNSTAQTELAACLGRIDAATSGRTSQVALLAGLSDVTHMELQRGVRRLLSAARWGTASREWQQELAAFLRENYFHADAELDLTVPRWGERPQSVCDMIEAMRVAGGEPLDPDRTAAAQREAYSAARQELEDRLAARGLRGLQLRLAFRKRLRRARAYLRCREEMREYSMQCYYLVRRYVLEAARRLVRRRQLSDPADVFMLHTEELLSLARQELAPAEAARRIAYRRRMHDGYRQFAAPNEFGGTVEQRGAAACVERREGRLVLQGTGCSAGRVEGTVRVVRSLAEAHRLGRGDVLVTRFTDPGWTPALGRVSAVVTEVGGILSHAAVIGREYGIPAVLNLPGATELLRCGQRVMVDGTAGLVTLLDEREAA